MLDNSKIEILDTTLREGEQTPGVLFTLEQKLSIAKSLDSFGIDFIEIGHPAVSQDIYDAVEAINSLDLRAKKIAHGRALKSDINDAAAIGIDWIGIFFGTSPLSLKHKFNITKKEALGRIERAIKYGKDKGLKLRFTAEDASRTEIEFLIEIGKLAQQSGADRFSLADTVGCLTPTKTKVLVKRIVSELDIPIHLHSHNDFGMATANSLTGFEAGVQCVDVTVDGLGERCGLSPLAEVIAGLVNIYKINKDWDLTLIPKLSRLVRSFSNLDQKDNKPLVGKNAFTHKAGLHVKAITKDPRSYEAFAPELVNRKRKIIIDKFTGVAALDNKYQELGIFLSKIELKEVLKKVKSHTKKVSWSNDELIYLIKSMGIKA